MLKVVGCNGVFHTEIIFHPLFTCCVLHVYRFLSSNFKQVLVGDASSCTTDLQSADLEAQKIAALCKINFK